MKKKNYNKKNNKSINKNKNYVINEDNSQEKL